MNKARGNNDPARVSRIKRKAHNKEKENEENEVKKEKKGLKRSFSENHVCTRKRAAFGDITNGIQSHANRIAQGRKVAEKKQAIQKPSTKGVQTRTSNRLKGSKSSSSIAVLEICVEDEKDGNQEKTIEEHCDDILQCCSSTSSEENEENVSQNESILPDGVIPFDLDEDPNHVCEYAHSIFKNMRTREARYPLVDYLLLEGRLTNGAMRAILVDWLVEVQGNIQLYHETLYVAVKLLDHYLQKNNIPKEQLQLVGTTALFIACKVEEYQAPSLDDFRYICDDAYTKKMFMEMEIKIFKALDFDINIPIAYRYLRRFSRVTSMGMELLTLARFILEVSLHASTFIHQPSSKMAASCLCLAMKMTDGCVWDVNHCYHSGYAEEELLLIMKQLNEMLLESSDSKHKTVLSKYSHPAYFSVAKTKPLPSSTFLLL